MALEIVDLLIKNDDFPWFFVSLPEGFHNPLDSHHFPHSNSTSEVQLGSGFLLPTQSEVEKTDSLSMGSGDTYLVVQFQL